MELNLMLRRELPRLLRDDRAPTLMQMMRELSEGRPPTRAPEDLVAEARRLGWLTEDTRLTPIGQRVGDSMREFLYGEERGRKLPRRDAVPELRAENLRGLRVLEVGSGFGCNLLRLQQFAALSVGVDIDPTYLAFGPLFARYAGLPAPSTVCASGEYLPFQDASFDRVLVIGALQYMNIERALAEIARVLVPTSIAVLLLGHLSGYLRHSFVPNARRDVRAAARETRDLVGMLTYPWLGRRLSKPGAPVYPSRRRMRRYLDAAGLTLEQTRDLGDETAYIARRR